MSVEDLLLRINHLEQVIRDNADYYCTKEQWQEVNRQKDSAINGYRSAIERDQWREKAYENHKDFYYDLSVENDNLRKAYSEQRDIAEGNRKNYELQKFYLGKLIGAVESNFNVRVNYADNNYLFKKKK